MKSSEEIRKEIEFKLYYVFSLENEYMDKFYPGQSTHKNAKKSPLYKSLRDKYLVCDNGKRLQDMPLGLLKRELVYLKHYGERCPNSSKEVQLKRRETCLSRYGNPTYNNSAKQKVTVSNYTKEKRNSITKKRKQTNLIKYGDENYVNYPKAMKTRIDKYGKFDLAGKHQSKESLQIYDYLVCMYGEDDVIKEYHDPRYIRADGHQYSCDFYVKSKDLFIEYHGYLTHNFRPFDKNNINHLIEVSRLKHFPKYKSDDIIKTWTIIDVEKRNIAKKNNLNYITIYPNDNIKDCINQRGFA